MTSPLNAAAYVARHGPQHLYEKYAGALESDEHAAVPILTPAELARVPLAERALVQQQLFTRIVHRGGHGFLVGRQQADIAADHLDIAGTRPCIATSDTAANIAHCLWCYAQGILPLIGDETDAITAMTAQRYAIDTLVSDASRAPQLLHHLTEQNALTHVRSCILIDAYPPDRTTLERIRLHLSAAASLSFVFALPEVGPIAAAPLTDTTLPPLTVARDILIESIETLTVTRTTLLPTPVIRYQPGHTVRIVQHSGSYASRITLPQQ